MDQIKIGRFISECRKKEGLTQMQLAEMLNITDRAVSKWERGKAMPDSSIMLSLCEILKISVNDLLCGEVVTMDNYNKEAENNLIEMAKQKERADKILLTLEIVCGIACIVPILAAIIIIAIFTPRDETLSLVIIISSLIPLLIATPFMLKIEQTAGYYVCRKCGHRYIPTYKSVFLAMHVGRPRYMKCPSCHKKSWQEKVISKNEKNAEK